MPDKLYHRQPCFCMPCKILRSSGPLDIADDTIQPDEKKPKKKRGKKS